MPLDLAEKERVRYHMGYLQVAPAAAITFGVPAPMQTLFLLESAMERILPEAEDRVRKLITLLDKIECKQEEALDYLVVNRVDGTEIREDQTDALEVEYCRWASKLAETVGAPLYPYAARFKHLLGQGSKQAGSIPVR